jgi:hypothetical protein
LSNSSLPPSDLVGLLVRLAGRPHSGKAGEEARRRRESNKL